MNKVVVVKPKLTPILKERGLTQMELSEMSGVPQGTISRFDRNERHEANILFSISRSLGIKIEELFEEVEQEG